ncbi:Tumor necrosis factor receptor superfamily member 6 [Labeo rohita]|uniref:Tumor necrosis factor receptor superfamily member 6 n=2 Tax=Labeo rohita TaxID=84645 RepID=A0ABQ8LVK2_LABRO|nr:Tumor necrosis factor receptor superfamily member 6 [Labeo rohita]
MDVDKFFLFLCCVLLTVGLTEGRLRRTRRSACEFGTYQHEGKTCCLCMKGYRVLSDCTDKNETYCERCEDRTYMDHPNSDHKCQPCKICEPNANMEIKDRCSLYSNTVCRCKENFYCDRSAGCKVCHPCDTCEEHGLKQPCTEFNNTVCHDATGPAGTIVAVLVTLILVAIVVVFLLWKKRKLCFKDKQKQDPSRPEEDLPLKDVDLNPHLSEISDVLSWRTMKRIAHRSGMRETDIEAHELNHSNDAKERTFTLLQAWSQSQGLHGAYPQLIKTLRQMNERRAADNIRKIVEKEAQPHTE